MPVYILVLFAHSTVMDINIFILCFNESYLLPHTITHYKKYLPSCKITIYDNESTDNSVEVAKSFGCDVVSWNSENIMNEYIQTDLKNNCWKKVTNGWILMIDMDEFVCITEQELLEEFYKGTTIIEIKGVNMIGESTTMDLTDIDLQHIQKYNDCPTESKHLCFLRESIGDMNYRHGAHSCNPTGNIVYSSNVYINKHMCYLGLPFLINKMLQRYERNQVMHSRGMNKHYINDIDAITNNYYECLQKSLFFEKMNKN
jgi:hypothetical protein